MAFDQYREMYFEGGVSSVYLWDLDQGFAGKNKFILFKHNFYLLYKLLVIGILFTVSTITYLLLIIFH